MRRGDRFPGDQAEVVFADEFVEQLGDLTEAERLDVLAEVVRLCDDPAGKHPLKAPLAGWNTLDVNAGQRRVVYKASVVDGCGLIEVLCLGPRSENEVYDIATGLVDSGLLTADEATALWDALALLGIVEEEVGLDGWDYAPPPAPEGMIRTAVAAGLLNEEVAQLLSLPELQAALEHGWDSGAPDPEAALVAALEVARARGRRGGEGRAIVQSRATPRCGAQMPRAAARCIRRLDHPGPHRAR